MSSRCPKCGTTFADDARFCTRDGTPLSPSASPQSPAPAAQPHRTGGPKVVHRPRASSTKGPPGSAAHKRGSLAERISVAKKSATARAAAGDLPAHATLAGQTLDGRFLIDRKVGEGGMSFVYQATDLTTNERRAVKVLSPSLSHDRNAMARLAREAELAGKVRHPNVCHIEILGHTANGLVYVVMPFVEGEILADRTYRLGQIPLEEAVGYVLEIGAGLQAAHDLKIVHRDLKPENIMIARGGDGRDHAVVMDFGLAKERRAGPELEKLTAIGIVLGTPEFMSPEQLRGKPLDGRSDVYSLALITVEMLTGTLPFVGKTQQEIMLARLRNEPATLRKMRPDLAFPASVERVVLKGLARNPDERYSTAPDFALALRHAVQGGALGGTAQVLKKWFG